MIISRVDNEFSIHGRYVIEFLNKLEEFHMKINVQVVGWLLGIEEVSLCHFQ